MSSPSSATTWPGTGRSRVQGGPTLPVFRFPLATDIPPSTSVSGLTVTGGLSGFAIESSPAILMAPLLEGNVITGNATGIEMTGSGPNATTIRSCTITDNRLPGGGLGVSIAGRNPATVKIEDCTIARNDDGISDDPGDRLASTREHDGRARPPHVIGQLAEPGPRIDD